MAYAQNAQAIRQQRHIDKRLKDVGLKQLRRHYLCSHCLLLFFCLPGSFFKIFLLSDRANVFKTMLNIDIHCWQFCVI